MVMLDDLEDRKLIRKIQNGDKAAFERLVERHYGEVLSYCVRRTGSREEGEDLTQEVFLKVIRAIYQYRFTGKFSNFLFTIAVNTCNDFFRRQRTSPAAAGCSGDTDVALQNSPSRDGAPAETLLLQEAYALLYRRLSAIPDVQREAILLHYYHGFKAREIAEITGVPIATAKSRIQQGMTKLRALYRKEVDEDASLAKTR